MTTKDTFRESNWSQVPIRDLGLTITGTPLEPVLAEFESELARLGLPLKPRFYLGARYRF